MAVWVLGLAALAVACHRATYSPGPGGGLADFGVYRGAVLSLRNGTGLYAYHVPGLGDTFTYPPFAGALFLPLAYLKFSLGSGLWTLVSACSVVAIAAIVGQRIAASSTMRLLASGALLLALSLSLPVTTDLRYGQVSVTLAALVIGDVLLLKERRAAGALVGVAAAIKLTPLIFVPYLWAAGRRRAAALAAAVFVAGTLAAWIVLPEDSSRFWLSVVFDGEKVYAFTSDGNISLDALLGQLGLGGPLEKAGYFVLAAVVLVVALRRARRAEQATAPLTALIVIGAASLLISPISWAHHQVWLVLAAVLPVRGPRPARNAWPPTVLAIMILPLGFLRPLLAIGVATLVPFRYGAEETAPAESTAAVAPGPAVVVPQK